MVTSTGLYVKLDSECGLATHVLRNAQQPCLQQKQRCNTLPDVHWALPYASWQRRVLSSFVSAGSGSFP